MRTLKLGGQTLEVFPLPSAWDSFALQPLIGPAVLELVGIIEAAPQLAALGGSEADVFRALPLIAPALKKALRSVLPADLRAIMDALFDPVMVETAPGVKVAFKTVGAAMMMGRTLDTWRLLVACIRENYPDFFALLPGKDAAAPEASDSKASTT